MKRPRARRTPRAFFLDPALEQQLRRQAAGMGKSTSEVIRAALVAYLEAGEESMAQASAYDLGRNLFGRFAAGAES